MQIIKFEFLPKADQESIKNIESITDVLDNTQGCNLHQHLHSENKAEYQVAYFHHSWQCLWLIVMLYAHAKNVVFYVSF